MKKLFSFLIVSIFLCSACNNETNEAKDNNTTETSAKASDDKANCLVGTWTMDDGGTTRAFKFNADKTGEEQYTTTDIRPFTWSMKDDKTVHIVYTASGDVQSSEWDLSIDCDASVLSWSGAKYTKK